MQGEGDTLSVGAAFAIVDFTVRQGSPWEAETEI